jgi:hypothetical protein
MADIEGPGFGQAASHGFLHRVVHHRFMQDDPPEDNPRLPFIVAICNYRSSKNAECTSTAFLSIFALMNLARNRAVAVPGPAGTASAIASHVKFTAQ